MDRLTWYQPGEYVEDIIIQSGHVGIYDGDVKQTIYEHGTASLTLHRIIWADSNDPDCRLILHHSLVAGIEKHHKSVFRRGGKIILSLHPKPLGQQRGPVLSSFFNYIRLVFRSGGEDEFFEKYKEALGMNMWERVSSGFAMSSTITLRNCNTVMPRAVGIAGIEKRLAENHHRTHESINQAFEDMNRLMEYAREMTVRFKTYLLSLGVSDPVTKSAVGSNVEYYEKLAGELAVVLYTPLKECGGMMTLSDVYCRVNRARGLELLSPEDILNACEMLKQTNLPISLNRFESGVIVVQLKEMSVETTVENTAELVLAMGTCNATKLAKCLGITVILAKERLLAAEAQAKLCRDDTVEGLTFYPNRFITLC
ncbi:Vacuolar protein-sorting-associated protein 36 [Dirofilaria immitis]|nr:Vacuolar protein-sorting-associated protein 36 [Dirofilaria immitis]